LANSAGKDFPAEIFLNSAGNSAGKSRVSSSVCPNYTLKQIAVRPTKKVTLLKI